MDKETKIYSIIATLSVYAYLREKYPNYQLGGTADESDIEEVKERLLEIEKYAHIPDKVLTIESKYIKLTELMHSNEFREEILLDSINKKSEYLTDEEKRDIINSVIFVMNIDHTISKNEKATILQIRKFLNYDANFDHIVKDYQDSELKESVSRIGLSYLNKATESISNNQRLSDTHQRLLSLLFLSLAAAMSFFEFTRTVGSSWSWLGINSTHIETVSFTPTFISTILAIGLITPLYLRNILKWNTSIYSIISLILILLVFASFIQLSLLGGTDNQVVQSALAIAILLSWVGLSSVAGMSWVIALGAGIYTVISNNITMGIYGYLYITFGFLGLILHSRLNPGELVKGLKEEYSSGASSATNIIRKDVDSSMDLAKKAAYAAF